MGKKILVTGATGFVGRHLLGALEVEGNQWSPVALVRSPESWEKNDWVKNLKKVQLVYGSVTECNSWEGHPFLEGLEGIFHLAAIIRHSRVNPSDMYQTNVGGLLNAIRVASKQHCPVIYISTSGTVACFRDKDRSADETAPYCEGEVASWPYYDSKIRAEKEGRVLAEKLKVRLVIVRTPMLLGPGDHRYRSTSHIIRLLRRKLPYIVRGGIHFVDIRDAVTAMIRILSLENPRPVYHLKGTSLSIDDFFGTVAEIADLPAPTRHLSPVLARFVAGLTQRIEAFIPGLKHPLLPDPVVFEMATRFWNCHSLYAEKELNYFSRDPRQTLTETIAWLRENHEALKEIHSLPLARSHSESL